MAFCNHIDTQMKHLWNGLVGQWLAYREIVNKTKDETTRLYHRIRLDYQVKEDYIENEVPVTKIYYEHFEEPHEIRKYIEEKMENDYFYKPYTIARALPHDQVKKIHNVLGRDELSKNMTEEELQEARKNQKWEDKTTKFLDLMSGHQYKTVVLSADYRPLYSEQIFSKKNIFTIDDKYVACDIRGENRLIFLQWSDMPNLV